MTPLTKEQGIVITGYTGIGACQFSDFHQDVERRLKRPVYTHEFANPEFWDTLKILYRPDFIAMSRQLYE